MSKKVVRLDVREDLKKGREPFSKIMQTVSGLGEDEDLLLIAPFEPKPLFGVLAQHRFSHQAKTTPSGEWEVLFTRQSDAAPAPKTSASPEPAPKAPKPTLGGGTPTTRHSTLDTRHSAKQPPCAAMPALEVDTRGLEPPQPLVNILEAVATLPQGAALRALTDRRPMHLYAQLDERGFIGETQEQTDGSFVTHIRRR